MNKETQDYIKEIYTNFTWKKVAFIFIGTTVLLSIILISSLSKDEKQDVIEYKEVVSEKKYNELQEKVTKSNTERDIAMAESQVNYDNSLQIQEEYLRYQEISENKISKLQKQINQKQKSKDEKLQNYNNDSLNIYVRDYLRTSYQNRHFK